MGRWAGVAVVGVVAVACGGSGSGRQWSDPCGGGCQAGEVCWAGYCYAQAECVAPYSVCDYSDGSSGCTDLASDVYNCGACGASCADGEECVGAQCQGAGANLFYTDFTTNVLDQFDIIDVPDGTSEWTITDNALHQGSNIYGSPDPPDGLQNPYTGTMAVLKGVVVGDFTYMVDFTTVDDDGIGVVFRFQDEGSFYRVMCVGDPANGGPVTRLERWDGGVLTILQYTTEVVFDMNGPNTYAVVASGPYLAFYLNDMTAPLLEATDFGYLSGRVGVALYAQSGVSFTRLELGP